MTDNTQPEALRLADEVDEVARTYPDIAEVSAELRRQHAENERLAALVEAQQPAPSAAAAVNPDPHAELRKTWQPGQRWQARSFRNGQWGPWTDAVASEPFWFPHQDYRRHPDDLAPQPSPTPQADSQPAPVRDESAVRDECKRKWLAEDEDCNLLEAYDRGWKDRAARAAPQPATADAVILKLVEALENHGGNYKLTKSEAVAVNSAIAAGRAALAAQAADSVLEDAARYRHLREADPDTGPAVAVVVFNDWGNVLRDYPTGEALDAAIDAARKQGANHD